MYLSLELNHAAVLMDPHTDEATLITIATGCNYADVLVLIANHPNCSRNTDEAVLMNFHTPEVTLLTIAHRCNDADHLHIIADHVNRTSRIDEEVAHNTHTPLAVLHTIAERTQEQETLNIIRNHHNTDLALQATVDAKLQQLAAAQQAQAMQVLLFQHQAQQAAAQIAPAQHATNASTPRP